MDGVDAALLRTDGETIAEFGPGLTLAYDPALRERIRALLGHGHGPVQAVSRELTAVHAEAVRALLDKAGLKPRDVAWLGFHGQTLLHRPDARHRRTWQAGDGAQLSQQTGIRTVADFRSQDVAMGGQGAPLVPLYHQALARHAQLTAPLLVLNLGGVGNVTYIGPGGFAGGDDDLIAFDTGPGNALIDDWMLRHTGRAQDEHGAAAAQGAVNAEVLARLMDHAYFAAKPPKSLDRNDFTATAVEGLSVEDGAATLAAFTAASVARGLSHLPQRPLRCLVCGGGRHNATLMRLLTQHLNMPVEAVETVGWRGDHLEAEAFAFLAARAVRGLALSVPGTTGVRQPVSGGRFYRP